MSNVHSILARVLVSDVLNLSSAGVAGLMKGVIMYLLKAYPESPIMNPRLPAILMFITCIFLDITPCPSDQLLD